MNLTIDKLKEVAVNALELAKKMMTENGELSPVVLAITETGNHICDLNGFPTKDAAFATAAKFLRSRDATAAITITDSYYRKFKKGEGEEYLERYKNGDMGADFEARECIIACIKGVGIPPTAKMLPYRRNDVGDIEWESLDDEVPLHEWIDGVEFNLLPNWWEIPVPLPECQTHSGNKKIASMSMHTAMVDSLVVMSHGNPGCATVLTQLMLKDPAAVLVLDRHHLYGQWIWCLYKYICDKDIQKMIDYIYSTLTCQMCDPTIEKFMMERK